jgi:hypothetical protein
MQTERTLETLWDREAIRDCLIRYCRGIDRCDRETLRGVYWPDGTDDHQSFKGNAYDFIEWCLPLTARAARTMHTISNCLIDLRGTIAKVETHFYAYECMRKKGGSEFQVLVGGRYLDTLEKRGDEWRIQHRLLLVDWYRNMGAPDDLAGGVYGKGPERMGRHDLNDLSVAHFAS